MAESTFANLSNTQTRMYTDYQSKAPDIMVECPSLHPNSNGSNSSEEALPPTYATLPQTTKLDEEPNPFEQSFNAAQRLSSETKSTTKPTLPPVSDLESPSRGILFKQEANASWDSLHTGPLSPTMLLGSARGYQQPTHSSLSQETTFRPQVSAAAPPPPPAPAPPAPVPVKREQPEFIHHTCESYPKPVERVNPQCSEDSRNGDGQQKESPDTSTTNRSTKRRSQSAKYINDEEKRKSFLERNRQAALKCRQRKKAWIQNLQTRVELLTRDNERLHSETSSLREELLNLKTMLLAHKSCSKNPQALLDAINRPIPGITPLRSSLPPATTVNAPTNTTMTTTTTRNSYHAPPSNNNNNNNNLIRMNDQADYGLNTNFYPR